VPQETPMRHPAYYLAYRCGEPGEPFQVQLPQGACLLVFATRERAVAWADAMLNDQVRPGVTVEEWRTLVEVERFWEKWRMDFNVMSLNAVPDPSATPYWEPMEELLKMWCRIEMHESE
jgi:hypothetical protein